jgi:hypothetical protein
VFALPAQSVLADRMNSDKKIASRDTIVVRRPNGNGSNAGSPGSSLVFASSHPPKSSACPRSESELPAALAIASETRSVNDRLCNAEYSRSAIARTFSVAVSEWDCRGRWPVVLTHGWLRRLIPGRLASRMPRRKPTVGEWRPAGGESGSPRRPQVLPRYPAHGAVAVAAGFV